MKKLFLIPGLIMFLFTGCDKVDPTEPSPLTGVIKIAPQVFAGNDFYVALPADSASLTGTFSIPEADIVQHSWRKINGPSAYVIEQPLSLQTKISNLVKGRYGFELTVADKEGQTGKDTVYFSVVSVYKENSSQKEVNFKDQSWECMLGGGCYIAIENFQSFIPSGAAYKVYIKRDNEPLWFEVENSGRETDEFRVIVSDDQIIIQANHFNLLSDSPDVKIVY